MGVDPSCLPYIDEQILVLQAAVDELLDAIHRKYPRPNLFNIGGSPRSRYPWPRPQHARLLKAVRVISALHAVETLLADGFTAESAVLFRTVDDFLEDIGFLRPDEDGNLTQRQQEFLDQYFDEDDRPIEERVQDPRSSPYVPRQKIRAHEAQAIADIVGDGDPHTMVAMSRVVDDDFSDAVHGGYASTMDLFCGPTREEAAFHMSGMAGKGKEVKLPAYVAHLAIYVDRGFNVIAILAHDLGRRDIFEELVEAQVAFEESEAYPN